MKYVRKYRNINAHFTMKFITYYYTGKLRHFTTQIIEKLPSNRRKREKYEKSQKFRNDFKAI